MLRYGPFPLRWGRFGIALALAFVSLGLAFAGTLHNEVHCSKETCNLFRHGPFGTRVQSFPPAAIRDVRVVRETGKSVSYSLALIDRRGAETRIARSSRESDLSDALLRARAFFVDGRSESFRVVEPQPTALLVFGIALFGVALFFVRAGFHNRASRRFVIDDRHITVQRGLFRQRSETFSRPHVTSIEVEHGTIPDPFKSRGQADEVAGRVVIVTSDGERIALSEELLAGVEPHQRMARELRELFELAPKSMPREAPNVPSPSSLKPILAFVSFAIVASVIGNFLLRAHADKTDGTLEVTCTNRCKFQGMECMPGGSWGSTLAPGDYAFEVFDASSPTQWTKRTVTIKKGETTQFACTPR